MKNNHKEWMTAETWRIVEERKQRKAVVNNSCTRVKKAKAQEEHSKANRRVKKSTKEDKHNYLEALATKAEEAAYKGNMHPLFEHQETVRKIQQN